MTTAPPHAVVVRRCGGGELYIIVTLRYRHRVVPSIQIIEHRRVQDLALPRIQSRGTQTVPPQHPCLE